MKAPLSQPQPHSLFNSINPSIINMDTISEAEPLESNMTLCREVSRAIDLATQHAKLTVHQDRHWVGPLLSDTSFTAQYIFTLVSLNQSIPEPDRKAYITYFLSAQADDGSWALAPKYPYGGNLSVTVETYLALKMLGFPPSHPVMETARNWILQQGGLEKVRNTTRVFLAMFGIISWSSIPQLPPELILLPTWFPLSIFKTGMWARTVIVPLLVLRSHEPVYRLPVNDTSSNPSPACYLDELWCKKPPGSPCTTNNKLEAKYIPYTQPTIPLLFSNPIALLFQLVDLLLLYFLSPILSRLPTRRIAINRCMEYMITRQEPEGPYGGFTTCLCFYLQCLALEGYDLSSKEISSGVEALRDNLWEWSAGGDDDFNANANEKGKGNSLRRNNQGKYLQASTSPIWDTLLMVRGLLDCRRHLPSCDGAEDEDMKIEALVDNALRFIRSKEIREENVGDWQVYRPGVGPGAYSFEYVNRWFPDVDDTAVAVLTFLEAERVSRPAEASLSSSGIVRRRKLGGERATVDGCVRPSSDGELSQQQGLESGALTREQGAKSEKDETGEDHIIRAAKWCLGMQNGDGGWAAFDSSDGAKWLWNSIVFSDMDCMCDSSCPDITGRCLEMFGLLKERLTFSDANFSAQINFSVHKGLNYLRKTQASFGGWWARWGINYLYGTSNALCGLYYFKTLPHVKEMIHKGINWIESVQNADGGWGEQDDSFVDPSRAGKGPSTPSQTAWALMALLRHVSPMRESVTRGVRWLVENQKVSARSPVLGGCPGGVGGEVRGVAIENGTWEQEIYTGVGHPNEVCFGYDMYRHYFPMIALGRYLTAFENRIGENETHGKERWWELEQREERQEGK